MLCVGVSCYAARLAVGDCVHTEESLGMYVSTLNVSLSTRRVLGFLLPMLGVLPSDFVTVFPSDFGRYTISWKVQASSTVFSTHPFHRGSKRKTREPQQQKRGGQPPKRCVVLFVSLQGETLHYLTHPPTISISPASPRQRHILGHA